MNQPSVMHAFKRAFKYACKHTFCTALFVTTIAATFNAHAQFSHLSIAQDIPACKAAGAALGECIDAIEKKALQQAAGKVVRKEGQLILNFGPGPQTLKNIDTDDKTYINYTYLGFEAKLQQHMMYVGFQQGDQFWAYPVKGGAPSKMAGYPLLAPDNLHFATMSVDMIAGFNPNLVEIWRVDGGNLNKVASFKGDKWGPDGLEWQDAATLVVKKVCNNPDPEHQEIILKCGTVKVNNGKAGWVLLP